jgi:hypothetical protein
MMDIHESSSNSWDTRDSDYKDITEMESVLAEGTLLGICETGLFLRQAKTDPC